MTKINSVNELPSWFNLANYDFLEKLSLEEICGLITDRTFLLEPSDDVMEGLRKVNLSKDPLLGISSKPVPPTSLANLSLVKDYERTVTIFRYCFTSIWANIASGNPNVKRNTQYYAELLQGLDRPVNDVLAFALEFKQLGEGALMGISPNDVNYLSELLESFLKNVPPDWADFADDYTNLKRIDLNRYNPLKGRMFTAINLAHFTDKEILDELTKCLPEWRKVQGVEENSYIQLSKPSHRSKIIEYRMIPYIDLSISALLNDFTIPHRVMVAVLFPKESKGELEFRQTILPFYKKILDSDYRSLNNV
jgi:hypothetical protein